MLFRYDRFCVPGDQRLDGFRQHLGGGIDGLAALQVDGLRVFADRLDPGFQFPQLSDPAPGRLVVGGDLVVEGLELVALGSLGDLRSPPGNRLEALTGDRKGQHSIRVNDQFRVCFVWTSEGPTDVEIVDYH